MKKIMKKGEYNKFMVRQVSDQTRPEKLGMQILLNYCYYFYLCLLESMSFLLLSFYVIHTECIIIRLQHHVLCLFALFASLPGDQRGRRGI